MSLSLTFLYSVLRSEASQSPKAVPFPVASLTLPRPAGGIPGPVTNVSEDCESAIGLPLVSKHTLWVFQSFWPLAVTRSSAAVAFESGFFCGVLLFDALKPVMASVAAATSGVQRATCPFIGASPCSGGVVSNLTTCYDCRARTPPAWDGIMVAQGAMSSGVRATPTQRAAP